MSTSSIQRREVHYSGRVQGVGFRFTTHRIARNYDVTGFVKNLADGRVHLVVEGATDELDRFLDDLTRKMSGYIQNVSVDAEPATGQFGDFRISF